FFAVRLDVDGTRPEVDDRRTGDSYLGNYICAGCVVGAAHGGCAGCGPMGGIQHACLPKRAGIGAGIGVGVKGVYGVALRNYENYIVRAFAGDRQVGNIERLPIDIPIRRLSKDDAELSWPYILRR